MAANGDDVVDVGNVVSVGNVAMPNVANGQNNNGVGVGVYILQ